MVGVRIVAHSAMSHVNLGSRVPRASCRIWEQPVSLYYSGKELRNARTVQNAPFSPRFFVAGICPLLKINHFCQSHRMAPKLLDMSQAGKVIPLLHIWLTANSLALRLWVFSFSIFSSLSLAWFGGGRFFLIMLPDLARRRQSEAHKLHNRTRSILSPYKIPG